MTIRNDIMTLWDNGSDKFYLFAIPPERQYKYICGKPCITVGFAYENKQFRGCDVFTLFDQFYMDALETMKTIHRSLNGSIRLYDIGADSDGYVDFEMKKNGKLHVEVRLGATFSTHSLTFEFEADQTLLEPLMQSLAI